MPRNELDYKPGTLQQILNRFDRTIYDLRAFPEGKIPLIAQEAVSLIGGVPIKLKAAQSPYPSMLTHFGLVPTYNDGFEPGILVDFKKLRVAPAAHREVDMVGLATVVSQFPDHGFQGRGRKMYSGVIVNQQEYLTLMEHPEVPDDPRTTDKDTLLYQHMRPEYFRGDTGYEDWQRAIDVWINVADKGNKSRAKLKNPVTIDTPLCEELFSNLSVKGENNNAIRKHLREVRDSVGHFIAIREGKTPFIVSSIGELPEFKEMEDDHNKIAETMANLLVQVTLLDFLAYKRVRLAA